MVAVGVGVGRVLSTVLILVAMISISIQASGIATLHKAGTIAPANRQGRYGCMGF